MIQHGEVLERMPREIPFLLCLDSGGRSSQPMRCSGASSLLIAESPLPHMKED